MNDDVNVEVGGSSHAASHSVEQVHVQNVAAGVVMMCHHWAKQKERMWSQKECSNSTLQAWLSLEQLEERLDNK